MVANLCQEIFYYILNISIIASILAIVILLLRKIFDKKISPKWKFVMWALLIISLIFPIKITIQSNNQYEYNLTEAITDITQSNILEIRYINIIIGIWLIGIILILMTFIVNAIKMNIKIRKEEIKDTRLIKILEQAKNSMNITVHIKLIKQQYKKVPCIYGLIKPKILLTEEIINKSDEDIKYIFLHELAHYKRKDLLLNKLMILITAFHWFNPIIWICFKQIRQDMELKADEMVLESVGKDHSKEYAKTLVSLLPISELEKQTVKVLYVTDGKKNMERRIKMIKLSDKFKEYKSLIGVTTILLTICVGMLIFTQIKPKEDTSIVNSVQYFETPDRIVYKAKNKDEYYVFLPSQDSYRSLLNQLIRSIEGLGEGATLTKEELNKIQEEENYIELDYDTISKNYLILYEKENFNVIKRTDNGGVIVRNNIKEKENLERLIKQEIQNKDIYKMSDNKEYKVNNDVDKTIVENDTNLKQYTQRSLWNKNSR